MIELATQARVKIRATIQYIVAGIQDDPANKTILYGAKTIRELKERFVQYECMRNEMKGKSKPLKTEEKKKYSKLERKTTTVKACFNCGEKNHISKNCPDKDKEIKCFKCNQHGHIAAKCVAKPAEKSTSSYATFQQPREKQLKEVEIANQKYSAVIDTGSDLSLMRRDTYAKVGAPRLNGKTKFDVRVRRK
ncbi:enzymatic poly [Lasius niger]|uniref:Enzymatic poly n=1 Tax=Lasius niger TaxID=67767 RepID=A0A0J7KSM6_LASNI|nr:enzymatic poly [Lasius niger]